MKKSDLTLIILTYNSQFWLKKTLQTLKEHYLDRTKYSIKTIVVDSHSSDASLEMLNKEFKWVEVMKLAENKGFAFGNNQALAQVTSRYAMLLNSDVEFTDKNNFDVLIEYMDEHSTAGVITPRVELAEGGIDWASHRGEPTPGTSLLYFMGLEKLFPRHPLFSKYHLLFKNMEHIHEIDACSGAAMLVRMSAVEKVGLLDERFFMYAEDLDWCKRFREAGYTIVYHPGATIIHHKYKSGLLSTDKPIKAKTREYFYDTMLQYYDKHYQNQYPSWVRNSIKYFVDFKKGAI